MIHSDREHTSQRHRLVEAPVRRSRKRERASFSARRASTPPPPAADAGQDGHDQHGVLLPHHVPRRLRLHAQVRHREGRGGRPAQSAAPDAARRGRGTARAERSTGRSRADGRGRGWEGAGAAFVRRGSWHSLRPARDGGRAPRATEEGRPACPACARARLRGHRIIRESKGAAGGGVPSWWPCLLAGSNTMADGLIPQPLAGRLAAAGGCQLEQGRVRLRPPALLRPWQVRRRRRRRPWIERSPAPAGGREEVVRRGAAPAGRVRRAPLCWTAGNAWDQPRGHSLPRSYASGFWSCGAGLARRRRTWSRSRPHVHAAAGQQIARLNEIKI